MTSKHTPGPWRVLAQEVDSTSPWTICDADHNDVAEAFSRESNFGPTATHEEAMANARLIAAAPDLKAFADEFCEACSIKAAQGSKAVLGITELNRLWDMARAAIAKTEPA